ncbi:hypothetical protein RBB78_19325 [Tunturiibacter empetritectus]|uniref:hypothetical protein n=1 Tax=Tunturiibacter empetritectus TaxID=3069691 RepID=UPI003D9B81B6
MSTQPIDITNPAILATIPSTSATFLMCPPRLYDVNYVINPWMAGNVHASSRTRAAEQWQRLYEAVSTIADVQLVEPQPGSPDMVFTANAGLERNGTVAISSFFHPERQGEEPHFRRWFEQAGYKVMDTPAPRPLKAKATPSSPPTAPVSLSVTAHAPSPPAIKRSARSGASRSPHSTSSTRASTTSTPASLPSKAATSCTSRRPSTEPLSTRSKPSTHSKKNHRRRVGCRLLRLQRHQRRSHDHPEQHQQ